MGYMIYSWFIYQLTYSIDLIVLNELSSVQVSGIISIYFRKEERDGEETTKMERWLKKIWYR